MAGTGIQGLLEIVFSPLEGLDIGYIYDKYYAGIDFILYLFVLIIACRASLARMFPGQYGRHLGTVVGIILAISLSMAEHTVGFSLKSFGPIAAGLITLMVAFVIYNLMRHAGAGHAACSATALIVTYFSMRAVLPGFFLWAKHNEWAGYLHTLLILAVVVAIWRVIQTLFRSREISAIQNAVPKSSRDTKRFVNFSTKQHKYEWHIVKNLMKNLTIKGKKECKKIINVLKQARKVIMQHGADPESANLICKALNELKAREHVLIPELERIRVLDVRLSRLDLSEFQQLKQIYSRLNQKQQAECKRLFIEERGKLGAEEKIANFVSRAEAYASQFDRCIDSTCSCLHSGKTNEAAKWITKAIEQENEAEELIKDIRKMEKILLYLLRKQMQGTFAHL